MRLALRSDWGFRDQSSRCGMTASALFRAPLAGRRRASFIVFAMKRSAVVFLARNHRAPPLRLHPCTAKD